MMEIDQFRRILEPAIRRVLHLYWRFARPMTLGVRAVVVDSEARVFLVKHSYVAGWHLPGGGVEPGETVPFARPRGGRRGAFPPLEPRGLPAVFSTEGAPRVIMWWCSCCAPSGRRAGRFLGAETTDSVFLGPNSCPPKHAARAAYPYA